MLLHRKYVFLFCLTLAALWALADTYAQLANHPLRSWHQYVPDLIVVKVGPAEESSGSGRMGFDKGAVLKKISEKLPASVLRQAFPQRSISNARVAGYDEFSNIYKIHLPPGTDVLRAIDRIRRLDGVIYAEPYYVNELLYIPDDEKIQNQNHLLVIHAYEAWDLEKGDSAIVIGMVDTGVDIDHPDLQNIAFNAADPVNGIDDDHDGYIDNYSGWDMSDEDNNPNADGIGHGSFVTGIASARTDNATGVAGVGFKSKFLPVKVLKTATNKLVNNYEGIVYAADHGCKVINLAWGGVYPWFKYGQDLINYAVLVRDAVVVAAAGNTPKELDFFPASFDNVLSVGSTDFNDNKAAWATYSYNIDLMAPGDGVYTTNNDASYRRGYGSSFAAPQVAGTAALVRAKYPGMTAQQVMERIRISTDDIYDVGSNMDYMEMLGRGRLNVYRALTDTLSPSVRQIDMKEKRSFEGYLFYGDTLVLSGRYRNFLHPVKNLNITLSVTNLHASIGQGDLYAGDLGTLQVVDNFDRPFVIHLGEAFLPGEKLVVRLDYHGDQYDDFQYLTFETTPEYFPVWSGDAEMTIASDGDLGYNADQLLEGEGVYFKGQYLADWLGFVLATDSLHVSDNIVNDYKQETKEKDFERLTYARMYKNTTADLDARSIFRESQALTRRLGVQVEQKILGWEGDSDHGYFVLEYRIVNLTDSVISHLNAGIFADWNISETHREDAAGWDESSGIGYVYNKQDTGFCAGLSMLTPGDTSYYALDVGGDSGFLSEIDPIFTDAQKYKILTSPEQKLIAGQQGKGNDVAQMYGLKHISLEPGEGRKVAFVMLFGNDLEGLKSAMNEARLLYDEYISQPPLEVVLHACYGDSVVIDPDWGDVFEYYADPSLEARLDSGRDFKTPPVLDDQLYYVVNLDSGYRSDVRTIKIIMETPVAAFIASRDTVLIAEGTVNKVTFSNQSRNADMWSWDFGNGYESSLENPSILYDQTGVYELMLIASNVYHCVDSARSTLLVAEYGTTPVLEDRVVCKGDTVHLQAANTDTICIFADISLSAKIFEGKTFITGPIYRDSLFYVVNAAETYESLPVAVRVEVMGPEVGFDYWLDTLDLSSKYLLEVGSRSLEYRNISWFINGLLSGNADPQQVDYSGMETFEIAQVLVDDYGCMDTASIAFAPVPSPAPEGDTMKLCQGMTGVVAPLNGRMFYYYADKELSWLLHKGSAYITEPVYENRVLYITGMDSLKESGTATMFLKVSPLKAAFSFSSDTLDLEREQAVTLVDESAGSDWSYWKLPAGAVDTSSVLNEVFEQSGTYVYELVAGDAQNCKDSIQHELVVVYITGLEDREALEIVVYPNPAKLAIRVQISELQSQIPDTEIFSVDGKIWPVGEMTLKDKGIFSLDISGLRKGLYFIKISAGDLVYFGKFLKL